MEGKFRVFPEITLAAIQVFVDEMFYIKISPNCARRTKEKEKYVIISNNQKGLEQVVHDLLPGAARKNCVQHIYMNLKKTYGGGGGGGDYLIERLWEIGKSTNMANFNRAMKKLKDFNENAHSWMIDHAKVRDKPLITMLELIRSKVMERIKDRSAALSKKSFSLCVKIKRILDDIVKDCVGYTIKWNGRDGFKVIAHCGWCKKTRYDIRRCPAKQSGQQAEKPTNQEKGKGKKPVEQSKRRAKTKKGETSGAADDVEGAADPVVGAADLVQQQAPNVIASEETEDPFAERRRERATRRGKRVDAMRGVRSKGSRAPRPDPIAWADHDETDDIIEILSLPEQPQNDDSDVEILKHKSEQAKKKRCKN
ncbi:hypothetical protein LIER_01817 [Lithospermum erythrorhizon]|uniref:MULE transposase domain-containing protein n=1 Tax=Lithospermum erythrorhizon TaxID=34254 RepID=A0AAV3NMS8_LITER